MYHLFYLMGILHHGCLFCCHNNKEKCGIPLQKNGPGRCSNIRSCNLIPAFPFCYSHVSDLHLLVYWLHNWKTGQQDQWDSPGLWSTHQNCQRHWWLSHAPSHDHRFTSQHQCGPVPHQCQVRHYAGQPRPAGRHSQPDDKTAKHYAIILGQRYCAQGEAGFVPTHCSVLLTALKSLLSLLFNTFLLWFFCFLLSHLPSPLFPLSPPPPFFPIFPSLNPSPSRLPLQSTRPAA